MSPAAARQRARYRRLCEGRCCLTIEVETVALTEALIAAKLLDPMADPGREDLAAAVQRLLAVLSHA